MIFEPTDIADVFVVHQERIEDERGYFARDWCEAEFRAVGLTYKIEQINSAYTKQKGTIRGLHFQAPPHWETKIVRCVRGSAAVVAVDLRKKSPTYLKHAHVTLNAASADAIYVPAGFAQGYQTLADETELLYLMSTSYRPELARGYRYDDPTFNIQWPLRVTQISNNDLSWAAYR